jgi:uncharacterized protein
LAEINFVFGKILKNIFTPVDIWIAAERGDVQVISKFASEGADVNGKRGEMDRTPLHLAAMAGQVESIKVLIALGAKINERDDDGCTSLSLAVQENPKLEVLDQLLKLGADINKRDKSKMAALDHAAAKGSLELFNFLIERGASPRSGRVVCGVEGGDLEILKSLVTAGADVDGLQWGHTPLAKAIISARNDMVQLLVNAGANLEQTDEDPSGQTPLLCAVALGHLEIVKLFVASGANVNVLNKFTGESALDIANCPPQNKEMADYLCSLGVKSAKKTAN